MSRADLAHRVRQISGGAIKASERSVRGWEKNEYVPGGETVVVLARAVDCTVDELFGEADDEEAAQPMAREQDFLEALRPLAQLLARREVAA